MLGKINFGVWLCALLVASCVSACSDDAAEEPDAVRRATWAAAPQDYNEVFPGGVFPAPPALSFDDQSIRQIVRISAGGRALRVRLSNLFGSSALTLDGVHVALALDGSSIDTASDTALRFDGRSTVTIPPGEQVWSDPAELVVDRGADLAITLYVASEVPVTTVHSAAQQTAYVASGNALSSASLADAETRTSYYWITGVDVSSSDSGGVIVAFGDSITDGVGSSVDTSSRYPNLLARRLGAQAGTASFGVVNEGISGNRILSDVVGPSGLSRFARDGLQHSGASHVIILLGINDIGFSGLMGGGLTAEDVTTGLAALIDQARAADLQVFLGTLTPLEGTMAPYYSEASEALRSAVNTWIRQDAPIDGVIDFDQAMRSADAPLQMVPAFDSGDHLHPNDAGYAAMAEAIDLSLF